MRLYLQSELICKVFHFLYTLLQCSLPVYHLFSSRPYMAAGLTRMATIVRHSFHRAQNLINLIFMPICSLVAAHMVPQSTRRVFSYIVCSQSIYRATCDGSRISLLSWAASANRLRSLKLNVVQHFYRIQRNCLQSWQMLIFNQVAEQVNLSATQGLMMYDTLYLINCIIGDVTQRHQSFQETQSL